MDNNKMNENDKSVFNLQKEYLTYCHQSSIYKKAPGEALLPVCSKEWDLIQLPDRQGKKGTLHLRFVRIFKSKNGDVLFIDVEICAKILDCSLFLACKWRAC